MPKIHPTAIVDPKAELADNVEVGAFAIIKGKVTIGPGTLVHDSTHIQGETHIGQGCKLGPMALIGLDPQHQKYAGANTKLYIGNEVIIREMASVHRAFLTGPDDATRIGDRCFLMSSSHVGHDCKVGNDVVLSAAALLAGHCVIDDRVFIGGSSAIHQFCRVGRLVIMAGNEGSSRDIPPFAAVRYGGLKAYNAIGCRRAGLSLDSIFSIRQAYHCIHSNRNMADAVIDIKAKVPMTAEVDELIQFIQTTKRGIHPSIHFRRPFQEED